MEATNVKVQKTKKVKQQKKPESSSKKSSFKKEIVYIPTSRVRKYVNNYKINMEVEKVLSDIKDMEEKKSELTLDNKYKKEIGIYMESREESEKKMKAKGRSDFKKMSDCTKYETAMSAITKLKYKFSNDSMQVLSIMADNVMMEIADFSIKNVLTSKKKTILPKFSVMEGHDKLPLYALYEKSPVYQQLLHSKDEDEEVTEPSDEDEVNVNFHIRKIIKHLMSDNSEFEDIKISNAYCKLYSDVVFDIIDRIVNVLMIMVETNNHKTITKDLLIASLKIIMVDNHVDEEVINKLMGDIKSTMKKLRKSKKKA